MTVAAKTAGQARPAGPSLQVTRRPERFVSDDRRVITRLFMPDVEGRARSIVRRVLALPEEEVGRLLDGVRLSFATRHRDVQAAFERNFRHVRGYVERPEGLSQARRLLVGAYFTMEFSFESAALFNPSIVTHPDQRGVPDGAVRFLMSLRATGEGHVSSIVFRTGTIDAGGGISFDPVARYAVSATPVQDRLYEKHLFFLKLIEMGAYTELAQQVLDQLGDQFAYADLTRAVDAVRKATKRPALLRETAENMLWLAKSNYELRLPREVDPSEIVIFPTTENESRGIEDARLVRFVDDDGSVIYFGTYTAYNGFRVLPQLMETRDWSLLRVHTLNGRYVQNKGMALFPRKIDGQYLMISRLDGENLYLMRSDNVYFWNDAVRLRGPQEPWELVQIGNNGSPLETEAGWLLLTHGVGPVRQYSLGVCLLDRKDPSRVIAHLKEPLIVPNEQERDGYVPNVVYTCGAIIHAGQLIIPYAVSDTATTFATVPVDQLLGRLTS